jgi:hypothetical protein
MLTQKSTAGIESGGSQAEMISERRSSRGAVSASGDKFDRRQSRESMEVIDVDQSPDEFVRDTAAQRGSNKSRERSQRPDSSDVERSRMRHSKSRSPSM